MSLSKSLILFVLISAAVMTQAKEVFQIEHLTQLKSAGNITISPDENLVAYTLSTPRDVLAGDEDGRADVHLYVIKGKTKSRKFIGGEGSISNLQFSADSESLYFRAKRGDEKHTSVYSISMSGGEPQLVYSFDTAIGDYAVSADNKTLFFVASKKDDRKTLKDKGFNAYAYEERRYLNHLWQISLGDTDAEPTAVYTDGHVSEIELSMDNTKLVLAQAPTHLIDDHIMQRDLVVIDVPSGNVKHNIDLPGKLGGFDISPDSSMLALYGGTDIHDPSDGVLMVADLASGELRQLTQDAEQHIVDVDWLERRILTVVHKGLEGKLVIYRTDGDISYEPDTAGRMVIRSADVAGDQIRFIGDSPRHPNEVFAVARNFYATLTKHNEFLSEVEFANQSTYEYKARDGETIQGVLITPKGKKPDAGWPLILMVHGGPEAHYSNGWLTRYSMPGQFGAAEGYAVFYPNYRGSTSRGVAFTKQHQADYAGKEFNDLVDGVMALAEDGLIDKDRVGITGGSYGGYASMWGATALSEYFKAAVAFVGISNQVSKFGTSDIPNEMYLVHSLKWPWDENNWMNLLQRSPIYHAGDATTPILILHGEKDTRVHPSQSMELYRSLKVRTETPVRLVFYPNEGHGNRNAAAQYDYALRLMRWMNTYLAEDATRTTEMPEFDLGLDEKLKESAE